MQKIATVAANDDAKLAAKVVAAMKAFDTADATRKEKAIAVGTLLAEAQKRHPDQKGFGAFLVLAGGIQLRRAQELIAIAVGRKGFEQQQVENAAKQQRHRDKLKAEKIEREKAKAALPKPEPKSRDEGRPEPTPAKPEADALRNAQTSQEKLVVDVEDGQPPSSRRPTFEHEAIQWMQDCEAIHIAAVMVDALSVEKAKEIVGRINKHCQEIEEQEFIKERRKWNRKRRGKN